MNKKIEIEHVKEFINGELKDEKYIIRTGSYMGSLCLSPQEYEELKIKLASIEGPSTVPNTVLISMTNWCSKCGLTKEDLLK